MKDEIERLNDVLGIGHPLADLDYTRLQPTKFDTHPVLRRAFIDENVLAYQINFDWWETVFRLQPANWDHATAGWYLGGIDGLGGLPDDPKKVWPAAQFGYNSN